MPDKLIGSYLFIIYFSYRKSRILNGSQSPSSSIIRRLPLNGEISAYPSSSQKIIMKLGQSLDSTTTGLSGYCKRYIWGL